MPPRSEPINVDRLRTYVAQGMSVSAIARRLGRSKPSVYKAIYESGLAINRESRS
jgi:transposase